MRDLKLRATLNRRFSVILLVVLSTGSCATRQPGDPLEPGYNTFSKQDDIQIGREAAAEISRQVDIVDNRALQQYVDEIGRRLAQQPEAEDYPYEFTLINQDSINAFALPGGPIFLHSGLIAQAENEAQLAGVMAHEIAHVALRHGTSQASKAQMVQLPAALAGAILGNGVMGQLGQLGVGLGANALVMKYSRNAEKEADALGARIMAGAGYDPREMATFFEKLEAQGGSRPPALLSSHPSPGNRVRLVNEELQTFQTPSQYGYRTGDFREAKQMVARLPEPQRPQPRPQQAAAAPSPPTGAFQTLRGRNFAVSYPQGWQTYGDQSSSTVTIAPPNGIVRSQGGGGGIGYGAVLSRYQPRYRTDLLNATWEIVQQLQELDPNLRVSDQPQQINIQGNQGLIVGLRGRSPYGGAERDLLLSIARPDGVYYMVFIAPESQYQQLRPTFEKMAQSIRFR